MTSTNIVKLNIGGTVFQTTKSTLIKYDGFFKTLLETSVAVEKDESGCIFVDRDPQHFRLVLNFMRDGKVVLPDSKKEIQETLNEAEYYLLEGLIELCSGELPASAKAEVSKGVRIVQSSEEVQQLRDKTKPLLVIHYEEKFAESFLQPSDFVCSFVQKLESRFDIFFEQHRNSEIVFIKNGNPVYAFTVYHNAEEIITHAKEFIWEKCKEMFI